MFNWIRFSPLFLAWRARRAGALDGRALIPHQDDARPPKYLLYLRDIGHWRAAALGWRWQGYDLVLYPAYVRAYRSCEQGRQLLDEAEALYEQAALKRTERGTDKNIRALEHRQRIRERLRRRFARAELRLSWARAQRQAKWEEVCARFGSLAAEMDHYMQIYSDANVKGRDQNDCPPGLLEENRPRLEPPERLRRLDWTVVPRSALTQQTGSSIQM